jgi:hypothetical protein
LEERSEERICRSFARVLDEQVPQVFVHGGQLLHPDLDPSPRGTTDGIDARQVVEHLYPAVGVEAFKLQDQFELSGSGVKFWDRLT